MPMSHGDNCGDKKNGCVHPHCESSGSTKPGMDREFADGWSAGADEVHSVNVRFVLDTDLLHPDVIQNGGSPCRGILAFADSIYVI